MATNFLSTIPNPFAGIFANLTPKSVADQEKAMERNSFGVSEVEEKTAEFLPQGSQFLRVGQTFESFFSNKSSRVYKYRAMSKFPEIMDALDTILNEAIVEDKSGIVVKFDTIQGVELPARVRKQVDEIASFVFNEVVRVRKNLAPLFKRFLVEGELYIEKVLNTKKNGLAGIKMLPPFRVFPLYERGIIQGYIQGAFDPTKRYNKEVDIKFGKNEIAYINYDEYTDGDLYRPEGFLEPASKVWNMLRQMEDAVVIYRLSRASERLMFNIEVGNLSPQKAAAEMNKLINQYRKNVVYDPGTGMVSQNYNSMAMHENYFLPQQDGKGSSITQLPGACIALDTKIPLLDGRTLELNEIIEEFEEGKKLWVYSCDPKTGEFAPGIISWAGTTRKDTEVLKITLDNGETITATPDHKFLTRLGEKKEAKDLSIGESLMPFYRKKESLSSTYKNDYEKIFDNNLLEWKFTHREVASYLKDTVVFEEVFNENDENKGVIHHKNVNRFDNSPENLCFMGWQDHLDLHASMEIGTEERSRRMKKFWNEIKENNPELYEANVERLKKELVLLRENMTEEDKIALRGKQSESAKKHINSLSPEERALRAEQSRKNVRAAGDAVRAKLKTDPEFREFYGSQISKGWTPTLKREMGERTSERNRKLWTNPELAEKHRKRHQEKQKIETDSKIIDKISEICKGKTTHQMPMYKIVEILNNDVEILTHFLKLNEGKNPANWTPNRGFTKSIVTQAIIRAGYKTVRSFRESINLYNHKIVDIQWLDEKIDTGTITVDGNEIYHDHHTFATAAGVYIFNSNLSELGDLNLFTKKLYIALKIPKSRWQDNQMPVYNSRPGEIEREEVKFDSFISRLHVLFKPILIDLIVTEMKLRGIPEEYLNPDHYDIIFSKNNYYSEFKDLQLVEEKLSILNAASPSILTYDNPNGILSTEFVLKKYFQMSDSDYDENKKFLEKEKKEIEEQRQAELEAEGMMNADLSSVNEVPFPEDGDMEGEGSGDVPPDGSDDAVALSAEEDVIKSE